MLCLQARAKINWTLDITGRREDGYHLMDMLMQSVTLHDTLWMEEAEQFSLLSAENGVVSAAGCCKESSAPVPFDENNLVYKAAKALRTYSGTTRGARVTLRKGIPSGAGMGGGSADAAAALIGLNQLWGLHLSMEELLQIGLGLGADVPFMLTGGLARIGGIGEIIRPIEEPPEIWLTLWQPCDGLRTGEIFSGFDQREGTAIRHPDTDNAERALKARDLQGLGISMGNVLETVSVEKRPEIARAVVSMREMPGCKAAQMTGSGSVVYGVFDAQANAESALGLLQVKPGFSAVTRTAAQGLCIL